MKYELYGSIHKMAKKLIRGKQSRDTYRMISIEKKCIKQDGNIDISQENKGDFINEISPVPCNIKMADIYPVENIVSREAFSNYKDSFLIKRKCNEKQLGVEKAQAVNKWLEFVENSEIPKGFRNGGLHYAGYILDAGEWCLPSWIWTNAALVRMYCRLGKEKKAKKITDKLIAAQLECGGWKVRNDYDTTGPIPILAPNDSAYIANNACIELYLLTGEQRYLKAALKCADWIMETAREDGMIYVGYDMKRKCWQKDHNIVDVGFTAGLFSRIYEITSENKYKQFLEKFVDRYINLFYIPEKHGFATSLNNIDQRIGGMFGRGQAWALEGLIPASKVLNNKKIDTIIENTIFTLIRTQTNEGGWPYNISRPLMGIDCKATSVIACALLSWYQLHPTNLQILKAVKKAYIWCIKHTANDGREKGGIFSYTTEGAVVHHMYTWTAFIYGSSYAVELAKILEKDKLPII